MQLKWRNGLSFTNLSYSSTSYLRYYVSPTAVRNIQTYSTWWSRFLRFISNLEPGPTVNFLMKFDAHVLPHYSNSHLRFLVKLSPLPVKTNQFPNSWVKRWHPGWSLKKGWCSNVATQHPLYIDRRTLTVLPRAPAISPVTQPVPALIKETSRHRKIRTYPNPTILVRLTSGRARLIHRKCTIHQVRRKPSQNLIPLDYFNPGIVPVLVIFVQKV